MPIAWYIAPYKRDTDYSGPLLASRYCEMDDHTVAIVASGGTWAEVEVLGNRAVVKVRASAGVLTAINGIAGFVRLPKNSLNDSLSDLTTNQKTALRDILTDMGYTLQEIQNRFGNDLGQYILKDVLRFMASKRLKPRYDSGSDSIILDGEVQDCGSIESLEDEVQ